MATFETTPQARWVRAKAARIVAPWLACLVGLAAVAAEPEARRTVKTVKTTAAVASPSHDAPPAAARPKKTTTPPTLTPAQLDALVDRFLESTKAPPASVTTDVEFVRRVILDVTGKLPTPEQTRAFLNTHEKDKRGKLIEHLLNTPDYAANWARYWRDVIRYHATNQNVARLGFNEMEQWLTAQIAKNRPWDEVAYDLITATGRTDENGAVAFALAHEAQPVEVAGEVARIFLGVQIQCAQCHDHPNDSWKRQQFHEFAAFFAGAKSRRANPGQMPPVFAVVQQGKPRYTMPDLKDPRTKVAVAPKFFLASNAQPLPGGLTSAERHEIAASYVTDQNNPWFAKAYVNRVWYALMGDAFTMPVDDMGPERAVKAPEVLEALADQWRKGGYDVRWLFRTILNSKAYQRQVRSTFSASGRTPFASNSPSRLRADQIFDSLAQALKFGQNAGGQNLGAGKGPGLGKAAGKGALAAKAKGVNPGRNASPRNRVQFLFGVDPSTPTDEVLGTIPQALFLMNSPVINRAIEARGGTVLGEVLAAAPDNRAALNALYLRVLAREPTAREVRTIGRYVEAVGNRREAFEDVLWGLVNSTEFITRR